MATFTHSNTHTHEHKHTHTNTHTHARTHTHVPAARSASRQLPHEQSVYKSAATAAPVSALHTLTANCRCCHTADGGGRVVAATARNCAKGFLGCHRDSDVESRCHLNGNEQETGSVRKTDNHYHHINNNKQQQQTTTHPKRAHQWIQHRQHILTQQRPPEIESCSCVNKRKKYGEQLFFFWWCVLARTNHAFYVTQIITHIHREELEGEICCCLVTRIRCKKDVGSKTSEATQFRSTKSAEKKPNKDNAPPK